MIAWLFAWLWYFAPAGAASYAAIYIYDRHESLGFAMVTGVLVGAIVTALFGALYWEATDVCEYCATGEF